MSRHITRRTRRPTAKSSLRSRFEGTGSFKRIESSTERAFRQARERQTTQIIKKSKITKSKIPTIPRVELIKKSKVFSK